MKLKAPINENYAATVVTIDKLIPLANCDNVQHANIFGNLVVVSKDVKVGDKGVFFPVETQLSEAYLHENNLYRDNTLNSNIDEKGYFELSGRIKCVRFRQNKSEGLFMPLSSLLYFLTVEHAAEVLVEGATFDELAGIKICEKYEVKIYRLDGTRVNTKVNPKKTSRLIENQFRFHSDTAMLGKNMHRIFPDTYLQITNKLHGTSFVASNILVKKKLSLLGRIAKFLGADVVTTQYDFIHSSRKVIKNDDINKNYNHFYGEDIWSEIATDLRPYLTPGLTFYGEAVGFTRSGSPIQRGYDYGLEFNEFLIDKDDNPNVRPYNIYIYRITHTNAVGKVFEFSATQVKMWCEANGIKPVPQYFYGQAKEILPQHVYDDATRSYNLLSEDAWRGELLATFLSSYNMERNCELCLSGVPAEGIVVRLESLEYEAYKLKAFRFREHESKMLDKGVIDIESSQTQ